MKKKINPIYLPNNMRMIDNLSTQNIDAETQEVTDNIIDNTFIEQFPFYVVKETDRLINVKADVITTPYDYTDDYTEDNAYPNGATAKYNRKILQIELPKADEVEEMTLWVNAESITNDWKIQIVTDGDEIKGNQLHLELTQSNQAVQLLLSSGQWYIISAYDFQEKASVLTDTPIITETNYYLNSFDSALIDTNSDSIIAFFPDNPEHLDVIAITDIGGNCRINEIALNGNGKKINNSLSPFIIDVNFSYAEFKYIGEGYNNWIVKEIPNAN